MAVLSGKLNRTAFLHTNLFWVKLNRRNLQREEIVAEESGSWEEERNKIESPRDSQLHPD